MANLKPAHAAAIARLRAYIPPPTQYFSLPLSRRAAVLVLLYADRQGELRVVLTMRAKTLSSYAGQAALPGGKADSLLESPTATARREAHEEIGLPLSDAGMPAPFRVSQLCQLPMNMARTELGVRPCVAWIEAVPATTTTATATTGTTTTGTQMAVEDVLIPRLDAREVAAVFTAPFESFLETHLPSTAAATASQRRSKWYAGQWTSLYGTAWRMHNFHVPTTSTPVTWAEASPSPTSSSSSSPDTSFRVFGMTARILVDAARVAFGRDPAFAHNSHVGDEEVIGRLIREWGMRERVGRMGERGGGGGVGVVGDGEDEGGTGTGTGKEGGSKM